MDTTLGGPAEDCSGATNEGQCQQAPDNEFNTCIPAGDGTTNHYKITCSGSSVVWAFHNTADCSDDVSKECVFIDPDVLTGSTTNVLISGCSKTYAFDECGEYLSNAEMGMGVHLKFKGSCPASADEPCFSREAEACRILDTSVPPSAAFLACFDEPATTVAERVKMTALTGGDYVLSAGKDQAYEFTRVIVNQHKLNEKRSSILKIAHDNGEIELTPDHVLLVDGQWAAAHTVKVGSSLSGSKVTAISHGVSGIINPVTVSGMIVAAGATGRPVVSSAYPEWIAEYMLEQNNGYYPLPVSMSNMLAYLFPATAQAYWDEVLEHAFAANQQRLGSAKLGLPTALVAPIMFVLDLLCSAGLLLFALANAKVIAALAAVAVVARARRVAKA